MTARRKSIVLAGTRFHFSITPEQIAHAIAKVDKYSDAEKIRRMDDVFAAQPALLGAAVQLPSLGVDMQLGEATREQDLVRNCCLAMTNAYLAAYQQMQ